jgi:hypothetical protein
MSSMRLVNEKHVVALSHRVESSYIALLGSPVKLQRYNLGSVWFEVGNDNVNAVEKPALTLTVKEIPLLVWLLP